MSAHPISANPTRQELEEWANCSVPDCEYKVTHNSDKCGPHTYGWAHVRENILATIREIEKRPPSESRDELLEDWRAALAKANRVIERG